MGNGTDLTVSRTGPVADYATGDFEGFNTTLTAYAREQYADAWTDFNPGQLATLLRDLMSVVGDVLTYNLNAGVRELWSATARRRESIVAAGKAFSFEPYWTTSSTVDLRCTLDPLASYPFSITTAHKFSNGDTKDEVVFQPTATVVVGSYPGVGYVDVPCTEGELFTLYLVGVSDASLSQRWQVPFGSVVTLTAVQVASVTWTKVTDLVHYSTADQVYKTLRTEDGNLFLLFGDGTYGAVPANGAEIRATFRIGGGKRGILGKNTIETLVSVPVGVTAVTNPAASTGGDDEQPLRSARRGIPAALAVLSRAVTPPDHAALALTVAGVAAAVGLPGPAGSRTTKVVVAPTGGGDPTDALKSSVLAVFVGKKMGGTRVKVYAPRYRDLAARFLLHVSSNYDPAEVKNAFRQLLTNDDETGIFQFDQLGFAAKAEDGTCLLSSTRLQVVFDTLAGLDRVETQKLTVSPQVRERESGNAGDGTLSNVALTGNQRRREYKVVLLSATTAAVYERILGEVRGLTDSVLTDTVADFDTELLGQIDDYGGNQDWTGWKLVPLRSGSTALDITSAVGQDITVSSSASLFTLTTLGEEYYLYNPLYTGITVDSGTYHSPDNHVSFQLTSGASPFVSGDEIYLDVYPEISDVILREDEYPQFADADIITRTTGGSRIR